MNPDMFIFWLRGYLDSLKGQESWNGRWEDIEQRLDLVRFSRGSCNGDIYSVSDIHPHSEVSDI